ncbi:MAG TPA: copper homeostasis periplasmic binding protein CopC [Pseudolabrys sp.]|nr:copper homeostasis periplasmic binding protein CopC [Pseudolabrys sp.]
MHRIIASLAALASLMLAMTPADAHAHLGHANPRVGSSVQTAPREVTLWFTEKLEPAFSRIEVRDASGKRVDTGKAMVDTANPVEMRIAVKPLPPGTYKVFWHVLSVDTHTTEGNFSFRVGR